MIDLLHALVGFIAEHWRDIGTAAAGLIFFYVAMARPEDVFLTKGPRRR